MMSIFVRLGGSFPNDVHPETRHLRYAGLNAVAARLTNLNAYNITEEPNFDPSPHKDLMNKPQGCAKLGYFPVLTSQAAPRLSFNSANSSSSACSIVSALPSAQAAAKASSPSAKRTAAIASSCSLRSRGDRPSCCFT